MVPGWWKTHALKSTSCKKKKKKVLEKISWSKQDFGMNLYKIRMSFCLFFFFFFEWEGRREEKDNNTVRNAAFLPLRGAMCSKSTGYNWRWKRICVSSFHSKILCYRVLTSYCSCCSCLMEVFKGNIFLL